MVCLILENSIMDIHTPSSSGVSLAIHDWPVDMKEKHTPPPCMVNFAENSHIGGKKFGSIRYGETI